MENTRVTIKTRLVCLVFALCGCLLAICAAINVAYTFTPAAKNNVLIDTRMHAAVDLPADKKNPEFNELLKMQGLALSQKPSEPFAWARLSYLRSATGAGDKSAFEALRMSDFVSPYEAQLLPDRAVAWQKFSNVETKEQKDYQDSLWQKSFTVAADPTWNMAVGLGITKLVASSLDKTDKNLAESWKGRMKEAGLQ